MKIVGFEANNGVRLGVVEGDTVIDLQAADASVPGDLGEVSAPQQWRPETARRSRQKSAGLRAPPARRVEIRACRWRSPARSSASASIISTTSRKGRRRDNIPKFPSIFFRVLTSFMPHLQPLIRPKKSIQLDYEAEMVVIIGKRAKHLTLDNAIDCIAGYSCVERRLGARVSAPHHAVGHGQEFRPHRQHRPLDGDRRRIAARRQGPQDREPAQRQHHAIVQHRT